MVSGGPGLSRERAPSLTSPGGSREWGRREHKRVLLLQSSNVLSREKVLRQRRNAAERLQDGVHVTRVAQVPQARHSLEVGPVLVGLVGGAGIVVICALRTALRPCGRRGKHFEGPRYVRMTSGRSSAGCRALSEAPVRDRPAHGQKPSNPRSKIAPLFWNSEQCLRSKKQT